MQTGQECVDILISSSSKPKTCSFQSCASLLQAKLFLWVSLLPDSATLPDVNRLWSQPLSQSNIVEHILKKHKVIKVMMVKKSNGHESFTLVCVGFVTDEKC